MEKDSFQEGGVGTPIEEHRGYGVPLWEVLLHYAPQRKDASREAACVPFAVSLYKKGIAENFRKYEKTNGATYI